MSYIVAKLVDLKPTMPRIFSFVSHGLREVKALLFLAMDVIGQLCKPEHG